MIGRIVWFLVIGRII